MKRFDIKINSEDNSFEFNGKTYFYSRILNRDKELIINEAQKSHKDVFEDEYDSDTLKPDYVSLYTDNDNNPANAMIVYTIHNKKNDYNRYACGDYYEIFDKKVLPHPYQGSICW